LLKKFYEYAHNQAKKQGNSNENVSLAMFAFF